MTVDTTLPDARHWREQLPVLAARLATLREPAASDIGALIQLLSIPDATPFGIEGRVSDISVRSAIERALADRAAGLGFTYAITAAGKPGPVGLIQMRSSDPAFEVADWECTLAPSARGTGLFVESMRLAGSFAFGTAGVRRLETRVLLENGRANTALRKLGAVQEGILRRSIRRHGEYVDQVLWAMLKEDWGPQWLSPESRVH
jgi:RimJ/RimL family protein N-acetyltransferase